MNEIVRKISEDVDFKLISKTPFKKARMGEPVKFEMYVKAKPVLGVSSIAEVSQNAPTWGNFTIVCDEGSALGGRDTAPSPLYYFTAGIGFCFLSHIATYINMHKLKIDNISLELCMRFASVKFAKILDGKNENKNQALGSSDGIELHLIVESEETEETIQRMHEDSIRHCQALQSIINPVPVQANIHVNGKKL